MRLLGAVLVAVGVLALVLRRERVVVVPIDALPDDYVWLAELHTN